MDELQKLAARMLLVAECLKALEPLARIADAYDRNELDETRPEWFRGHAPETVELYAGRGGKRLLTLADCLEARRALDALGVARRRG